MKDLTLACERLFVQIAEECTRQKPRLFLWSPVLLACGIGLYFLLPSEPPLALGSVIMTAAVLALLQKPSSSPLLVVLIIAVGFFAAQIRAHTVYTPILQKDLGPRVVSGQIQAIEDLEEGSGVRLVLEHVSIEGVEPGLTPRKIRITSRTEENLAVGQRIETLAKLHSPSPPLLPGGFDFQRYLYFQGIGAVGFIYRDITILEDYPRHGFFQLVEHVRRSVAARVEHVMEGSPTGMAIALLTGRKTAIAEEDKEAMRNAGLAHMLAISGLHVGLFSGVLFFFMRFVLALIPGFALRYPIKKWSAVFALLGAAGYTLLAGANIPTQRALIMTALVFLAIIVDRSPISLRLVAFAALCVLLLFPESLLSASFHMSFAAVASLIIFYDRTRDFWVDWHRKAGMARRTGLYFAGICATTIVSDIATAPFALFHFNQWAIYSVLGNLIAMPILAFVIMPFNVLALALMPVGLDFLPFTVVDLGIVALLDTAHWVSSLPHAVVKAPSWPLTSLVFLVLGFLFLALWEGRKVLLSAAMIIIAAISFIQYNQPDILISSDYKLIAVNGKNLQLSGAQREKFVSENWAQFYGVEDDVVQPWPKERGDLIQCDSYACLIRIRGKTLSLAKNPVVVPELCSSSDIVLADFPLPECKAPHIDLFDVLDDGSHAIWIRNNNKGYKISKAAHMRGYRLWSTANLEDVNPSDTAGAD